MPNRTTQLFRSTLVSLAISAAAGPLTAHEYWIAPETGHLEESAAISAQTLVGQNFSGASLAFLDTSVKAMTHWSGEVATPIGARLGDRPAIGSLTLASPGLHRITVETHPAYIVFDTFPEFEAYLLDEGLASIADSHRQRGLPDTEIAEAYVRNARALVQVGPVETGHVDAPTGMPFEIVATGNPYTPDATSLGVRLLWKGEPEDAAQISVFHVPVGGKAPADTEKLLVRTNVEGRVEIPVNGPGQYLLNAVRIEPVDGPGSVVWQSHWASLTFEIASHE
ncbi:MAG: DUF4198 domain-containing protein [Silicimonas sp.]|nr:DUF4198 domain-containing protein [Silicimonas sp.]